MDRDMWDQIEKVLQRTCAVGRVEVVKVTAHQDTKEQEESVYRITQVQTTQQGHWPERAPPAGEQGAQ